MMDLEYKYWLLILFATLFPVSGQGHEACYDDSWTYHQHTHSCLRLYRTPKKWTEARDYCAGIQLGSNYGVVTRLAKIDDNETNYFVRTLFPKPGWACWIGLHKTKGQFRWDGYPDETPKYTSPNWANQSKPYVFLLRGKDMWDGESETATRHFECQHDAKKIGPITCQQEPEANGLRFTCTSAPSPTKAKCQWTFRYNGTSYGRWTQVNKPSLKSHTTNAGGDISYTTKCSFSLANINPGTIDIKFRMYPDIAEINLSKNGKARTFIGIKRIVEVVKPTKVTCQSDLHPDRLLVSCQIDKIFPQALCTFSYRSGKNASIDPKPPVNIEYSHDFNKDGNDLLYYKSSCSINLPRGNSVFSSGDLTIEVKVNQETASDDFISTQETVTIVAPSKPQFQRLGKPLDSSNPLHLVQNDRIDVQCQVLSGTPSVYSVTLSCDFSFNDSDEDNKHTVAGTAYVIDQTASRDMNGESCTCIGNHLTGPIESSPLTFNVKYPAEVKQFAVNEHEALLEVNVNETLAWSCEADGNPMPFVRIRKLGTNYLDTSTWQSDRSESRVAITLAAQCDHNGRYRCSVGNTFNNDEESRELDVRVRCPPTYCNESSRDIKMAVRPGRSQTVSLCVVAYPMPNFTLWKNSTTGWTKLDSSDDQFTQVTTFDSQQNVTIKFPVLQPSNLGQYALTDSAKKDVTSTDLHFQLTEYRSKGDDDEDDVGVIVAAVVSVVVVIIIVVVVVIFFLWRRKKKDAKGESPYENTGTASSENKTYYGRDNYTQVDVPRTEKGAKNKENKTQGGDIYTQVDVSKAKKGVTVYDNDGFLKESDNTKDNGPEKEEDTEGAYQQTADQDTKPENKTSESRKASGEDDMVYIELDFKYKADDKAKPQKKSKPKSKPKEVKRDDNQDEPSVYSSISANATIKIKLEKEKKEEEEKNQNKGAAAGGEEAVYENVKRESDVP